MATENIIYVENVNSVGSEIHTIENFPLSKTVRELKTAIGEKLGKPVQVEDVTVYFGSQELDDLNQTLASYGICNRDTLDFAHFTLDELKRALNETPVAKTGVEIHFKDVTAGGRTHVLKDVPPTWTVKQLGERFAEEKGKSYEGLRFLWKGKTLDDNKTLLFYGTEAELEGCTIDIVSRVHGGS